jgi:hypothetical protein
MSLLSLIPTSEVKAKFADELETVELGFDNFDEICRADAMSIYAASLNIWNRIVQGKLRDVDPMALAPYLNGEDPTLYQQIEKIIGEPVIYDAAYFHADLKGATVAHVMLLRVFPNNLHFADVNFVNPAHPIARHRRKRAQTHRGLGLLPTLVTNMKRYAHNQDLDYITLTAAYDDLIPLFERHGFIVEQNPMADICVSSGQCIPMEMSLRVATVAAV